MSGSDHTGGWADPAAVPDGPPPTPYERGAAPAAAPTRGPAAPTRRRGRAVVIALAAVVLLGGGAALLADRATGPSGPDAGGPAATAPDAEADAALLALLGAVDAAELGMLGFDEAAGEAFADAASEDEALRGAGVAAAAAAADLMTARTGFAEPLPSAPAEAVRAAYLPHLDAWIAYLEAIAGDPQVLLGAASEPLLLRINATAGVFADALEGAVAAGVGPEVEAAARAILDRGFPDQDAADL